MDTPSFAEIKEKFSKMNNLPYNRPRASTINNEPSSVAASPSVSEKLKTESSNQTLGKILLIQAQVISLTDDRVFLFLA